jgi:hypothetical protein
VQTGPTAEELRAIGRRCTELAAGFPDFVHRRVSNVVLEHGEFARMRSSVDFTLPQDALATLSIDGVGTFVPFAWLTRGPLRGFDLTCNGQSVPMVTAEQTREITRGMLEELLAGRDGDATEELEQLGERLDDLALNAAQRTTMLRAFVAARGLDTEPAEEPDALRVLWPEVAWLFEALSERFLAIAVLPAKPSARAIIKYSSDVQIRGLSSSGRFEAGVRVPLPAAPLAASHHLDVTLPEELRCGIAHLVDERTGQLVPGTTALHNVDRIGFYTRRAQLTGGGPVLRFTMFAEARVFSLPALILSVVLLGLLAAGWFLDPARLEPAATTILFAAFGALTAAVQRETTNPLARRLLALPRLLLAACGLAILVAGASVGLATGDTTIRCTWTVAIGVVAYAVALLSISAALGTARDGGGTIRRPARYACLTIVTLALATPIVSIAVGHAGLSTFAVADFAVLAAYLACSLFIVSQASRFLKTPAL